MPDDVAATLNDLPTGNFDDPPVVADSDKTVTQSKVPAGVPEDDIWPDSARARIDALKAEAQANRQKADQYERLYGGTSELKALHEASLAYAEGDPTSMERIIVENAASMHGLTVDEYMARFEDVDEDDRPMTKKEMLAFLDEQRQAQEQQYTQEQSREIVAHAQKLGYEPGSRPYRRLLDLAMYEYGNDLDEAHKTLESESQGVIDSYIKGQREKAKSGLRTGSGTPPSGERDITQNAKTSRDVWKNADAAADEFLSSRL